ncbi:hypothetical protein BBP40_001333 [Aspergillus hancockii]|nr:hypothetical protein BBP40_001333 [Aspergillus hancockii]
MVAEYPFRGRNLDNDLFASISLLLCKARVPNLLWGNYLQCMESPRLSTALTSSCLMRL